MNEHVPAQLQDRFYSIGGGSMFVRLEDIDERPAVVITIVELPQPEPAAIAISVTPVLTPPVPWYRRLWTILNMDIRDLWRMWRGR